MTGREATNEAARWTPFAPFSPVQSERAEGEGEKPVAASALASPAVAVAVAVTVTGAAAASAEEKKEIGRNSISFNLCCLIIVPPTRSSFN